MPPSTAEAAEAFIVKVLAAEAAEAFISTLSAAEAAEVFIFKVVADPESAGAGGKSFPFWGL